MIPFIRSRCRFCQILIIASRSRFQDELGKTWGLAIGLDASCHRWRAEFVRPFQRRPVWRLDQPGLLEGKSRESR